MNQDHIPKLLTDIWSYAAFIGAALGAVAALVTSILSFRARTPRPPDPTANLEDMVRADEVRDSLKQNERVARWAGRSNGLLLFGQVVIGGFLASAFVQDNLNTRLIGGLGVLVLLSSLVHQLSRPDIKYRGARRRVVLLRHLLREAEDAVFMIQQNSPLAEPIDRVRHRVSRKLSQIESSEVDELPGEIQALPPGPRPGAA